MPKLMKESMFFFAKKNQETRATWRASPGRRVPELTKVFCVVSSEKKTFLRIVTALLFFACGLAPAAAQHTTVTVTQKQPLPTPDNGAPDAKGKPQPVYHLLGFSLRGTNRVDTDAIVATLPQHEGEVITNAQIMANVDKVKQALAKSHVHGDLTTMILQREGPGHKVWVMWDVQPLDALAYAPTPGPWHFDSQTFSGNVKLSTDALVAATGLHPGEKLLEGRIGDARTGIEQAYDKAMPGADVKVSGKVRVKQDKSVLVDWQIVEPKTPAAH